MHARVAELDDRLDQHALGALDDALLLGDVDERLDVTHRLVELVLLVARLFGLRAPEAAEHVGERHDHDRHRAVVGLEDRQQREQNALGRVLGDDPRQRDTAEKDDDDPHPEAHERGMRDAEMLNAADREDGDRDDGRVDAEQYRRSETVVVLHQLAQKGVAPVRAASRAQDVHRDVADLPVRGLDRRKQDQNNSRKSGKDQIKAERHGEQTIAQESVVRSLRTEDYLLTTGSFFRGAATSPYSLKYPSSRR